MLRRNDFHLTYPAAQKQMTMNTRAVKVIAPHHHSIVLRRNNFHDQCVSSTSMAMMPSTNVA